MSYQSSGTSTLIDQLAGGFRAAQILFTATRLKLFAALGRSEMSVSELAEKTDTSGRGIRILCNALVALGVLEKRDGAYRNGPEALSHLLADSPDPKTAQLHHTARLYDRWRGLYDAVVDGGPVGEKFVDPRLPGGKREFALAMADSARNSARLTADSLDLSEDKTLLDLGGGPGLFAIEFAGRNPNLQITILDNDETLLVAAQNIERAGFKGRIHPKAGDGFESDLGGPYDVVFLSNLIHIYSYDKNQKLVDRCNSALRPGGRLVLKDFILDPTRTSPEWSALFAVNMLVATEDGDCYTVSDIQEWFERTELAFQEKVKLTNQSFLVIAKKREG